MKPISKRMRRINRQKDADQRLDMSVFRSPIRLGGSPMNQILNAVHYGSPELSSMLHTECNFIFECKVCRALFRDLPNFISHKRGYCQRFTHEEEGTSVIPDEDVLVVVEPQDADVNQSELTATSSEMPDVDACSSKPVDLTVASMTDQASCGECETVTFTEADPKQTKTTSMPPSSIDTLGNKSEQNPSIPDKDSSNHNGEISLAETQTVMEEDFDPVSNLPLKPGQKLEKILSKLASESPQVPSAIQIYDKAIAKLAKQKEDAVTTTITTTSIPTTPNAVYINVKKSRKSLRKFEQKQLAKEEEENSCTKQTDSGINQIQSSAETQANKNKEIISDSEDCKSSNTNEIRFAVKDKGMKVEKTEQHKSHQPVVGESEIDWPLAKKSARDKREDPEMSHKLAKSRREQIKLLSRRIKERQNITKKPKDTCQGTLNPKVSPDALTNSEDPLPAQSRNKAALVSPTTASKDAQKKIVKRLSPEPQELLMQQLKEMQERIKQKAVSEGKPAVVTSSSEDDVELEGSEVETSLKSLDNGNDGEMPHGSTDNEKEGEISGEITQLHNCAISEDAGPSGENDKGTEDNTMEVEAKSFAGHGVPKMLKCELCDFEAVDVMDCHRHVLRNHRFAVRSKSACVSQSLLFFQNLHGSNHAENSSNVKESVENPTVGDEIASTEGSSLRDVMRKNFQVALKKAEEIAVTKHVESLIKCSICNMTFQNDDQIELHVREVHVDDKLTFPCFECKLCMTNVHAVMRHLKLRHGKSRKEVEAMKGNLIMSALSRFQQSNKDESKIDNLKRKHLSPDIGVSCCESIDKTFHTKKSKGNAENISPAMPSTPLNKNNVSDGEKLPEILNGSGRDSLDKGRESRVGTSGATHGIVERGAQVKAKFSPNQKLLRGKSPVKRHSLLQSPRSPQKRLKTHGSASSPPYICPWCKRYYNRNISYVNHLQVCLSMRKDTPKRRATFVTSKLSSKYKKSVSSRKFGSSRGGQPSSSKFKGGPKKSTKLSPSNQAVNLLPHFTRRSRSAASKTRTTDSDGSSGHRRSASWDETNNRGETPGKGAQSKFRDCQKFLLKDHSTECMDKERIAQPLLCISSTSNQNKRFQSHRAMPRFPHRTDAAELRSEAQAIDESSSSKCISGSLTSLRQKPTAIELTFEKSKDSSQSEMENTIDKVNGDQSDTSDDPSIITKVNKLTIEEQLRRVLKEESLDHQIRTASPPKGCNVDTKVTASATGHPLTMKFDVTPNASKAQNDGEKKGSSQAPALVGGSSSQSQPSTSYNSPDDDISQHVNSQANDPNNEVVPQQSDGMAGHHSDDVSSPPTTTLITQFVTQDFPNPSLGLRFTSTFSDIREMDGGSDKENSLKRRGMDTKSFDVFMNEFLNTLENIWKANMRKRRSVFLHESSVIDITGDDDEEDSKAGPICKVSTSGESQVSSTLPEPVFPGRRLESDKEKNITCIREGIPNREAQSLSAAQAAPKGHIINDKNGNVQIQSSSWLNEAQETSVTIEVTHPLDEAQKTTTETLSCEPTQTAVISELNQATTTTDSVQKSSPDKPSKMSASNKLTQATSSSEPMEATSTSESFHAAGLDEPSQSRLSYKSTQATLSTEPIEVTSTTESIQATTSDESPQATTATDSIEATTWDETTQANPSEEPTQALATSDSTADGLISEVFPGHVQSSSKSPRKLQSSEDSCERKSSHTSSRDDRDLKQKNDGNSFKKTSDKPAPKRTYQNKKKKFKQRKNVIDQNSVERKETTQLQRNVKLSAKHYGSSKPVPPYACPWCKRCYKRNKPFIYHVQICSSINEATLEGPSALLAAQVVSKLRKSLSPRETYLRPRRSINLSRRKQADGYPQDLLRRSRTVVLKARIGGGDESNNHKRSASWDEASLRCKPQGKDGKVGLLKCRSAESVTEYMRGQSDRNLFEYFSCEFDVANEPPEDSALGTSDAAKQESAAAALPMHETNYCRATCSTDHIKKEHDITTETRRGNTDVTFLNSSTVFDLTEDDDCLETLQTVSVSDKTCASAKDSMVADIEPNKRTSLRETMPVTPLTHLVEPKVVGIEDEVSPETNESVSTTAVYEPSTLHASEPNDGSVSNEFVQAAATCELKVAPMKLDCAQAASTKDNNNPLVQCFETRDQVSTTSTEQIEVMLETCRTIAQKRAGTALILCPTRPATYSVPQLSEPSSTTVSQSSHTFHAMSQTTDMPQLTPACLVAPQPPPTMPQLVPSSSLITQSSFSQSRLLQTSATSSELLQASISPIPPCQGKNRMLTMSKSTLKMIKAAKSFMLLPPLDRTYSKISKTFSPLITVPHSYSTHFAIHKTAPKDRSVQNLSCSNSTLCTLPKTSSPDCGKRSKRSRQASSLLDSSSTNTSFMLPQTGTLTHQTLPTCATTSELFDSSNSSTSITTAEIVESRVWSQTSTLMSDSSNTLFSFFKPSQRSITFFNSTKAVSTTVSEQAQDLPVSASIVDKVPVSAQTSTGSSSLINKALKPAQTSTGSASLIDKALKPAQTKAVSVSLIDKALKPAHNRNMSVSVISEVSEIAQNGPVSAININKVPGSAQYLPMSPSEIDKVPDPALTEAVSVTVIDKVLALVQTEVVAASEKSKVPGPAQTFALRDEIQTGEELFVTDECHTGLAVASTDETQTAQELASTSESQTAQELASTDESQTAQELTSTDESQTTQELTSTDECQTTQELTSTDETQTTQELTSTDESQTTQELTSTDECQTTQELTLTDESQTTQELTSTDESQAAQELTSTDESQTAQELTSTDVSQTAQELTSTDESQTTQELTSTDESQTAQELTSTDESQTTQELTSTDESQTAQELTSTDESQTAQELASTGESQLTQALSIAGESQIGQALASTDESQTAQELTSTDESQTAQELTSTDESQTAQELTSTDENQTAQELTSTDESQTAQELTSTDESQTAQELTSTDEGQTAQELTSTDESQTAQELASTGESELTQALSIAGESQIGQALASTDENQTAQELTSTDDSQTAQDLNSTDESQTAQELTSTDEGQTAQELTSTDESQTAQELTSTDEGQTAQEVTSTDERQTAQELTSTDESQTAQELTSTYEGQTAQELTSTDESQAAQELTSTDENHTAQELTSTDESQSTQELTSTDESQTAQELTSTGESQIEQAFASTGDSETSQKRTSTGESQTAQGLDSTNESKTTQKLALTDESQAEGHSKKGRKSKKSLALFERRRQTRPKASVSPSESLIALNIERSQKAKLASISETTLHSEPSCENTNEILTEVSLTEGLVHSCISHTEYNATGAGQVGDGEQDSPKIPDEPLEDNQSKLQICNAGAGFSSKVMSDSDCSNLQTVGGTVDNNEALTQVKTSKRWSKIGGSRNTTLRSKELSLSSLISKMRRKRSKSHNDSPQPSNICPQTTLSSTSTTAVNRPKLCEKSTVTMLKSDISKEDEKLAVDEAQSCQASPSPKKVRLCAAVRSELLCDKSPPKILKSDTSKEAEKPAVHGALSRPAAPSPKKAARTPELLCEKSPRKKLKYDTSKEVENSVVGDTLSRPVSSSLKKVGFCEAKIPELSQETPSPDHDKLAKRSHSTSENCKSYIVSGNITAHPSARRVGKHKNVEIQGRMEKARDIRASKDVFF